MSWCVLDSSLYWWFRLWRLRRFLVGCARYVCRGWESSLLSFSPWMRILRLVPSYISGVHHSSSSPSVYPTISLGFTILLLHVHSQLYLWGSPFFFFMCIPSYISGVHHSSFCVFPVISLGFTILLLLLCSQLYLWGSPFFFFFCVPSYISGIHHSFFFCVPSYISGIHHSSFFFCVPSYISGVHHSSSCAFPVTFCLCGWCMLGVLLLPAFTLSKTMLTPREKTLLPEAQRRSEPTALHQAGQWAPHTTNWAMLAQEHVHESHICSFCLYRPARRWWCQCAPTTPTCSST